MMISDFSIKANIGQISYIQSDSHHFLVCPTLLTENSRFSFATEYDSVLFERKKPRQMAGLFRFITLNT
jgi:hypothetical protein